jgi:UPF0716 protein FxsA
MRYLVPVFIVVPLAELYLLLWVSRQIGFVPTVALTIFTGILGSTLARHEGLRAWREWQRSLSTLSVPEVGLVEGALILTGGVLLITPGIATDTVGFALLIPWTRRKLAAWLREKVRSYVEHHTVVMTPPPGPHQPGREHGGVVDTSGYEVEGDR